VRTLAIAFALLLIAPAAALAKTTPDFTYKSTGKAAAPGAVAGTGADGTYEDFPFTIAADDTDGQVAIEVHWSNGADDFDLTVYRKNSTGDLDQVGSSAGGAPGMSEATTVQQQGSDPVQPGEYVIRVQNYAASNPDFEGVAKFTEFAVPNQRPTAKLKAPKKATAGKAVTLDASGSQDPDGQLVNYAWDLDGDGSVETDGGTSPTLSHAFPVGVHHVSVRVTDNKGRRAYATRTIRVKAPRVKRRGNR
jgi:PKD domain